MLASISKSMPRVSVESQGQEPASTQELALIQELTSSIPNQQMVSLSKEKSGPRVGVNARVGIVAPNTNSPIVGAKPRVRIGVK
jgi:hypothetical protein